MTLRIINTTRCERGPKGHHEGQSHDGYRPLTTNQPPTTPMAGTGAARIPINRVLLSRRSKKKKKVEGRALGKNTTKAGSLRRIRSILRHRAAPMRARHSAGGITARENSKEQSIFTEEMVSTFSKGLGAGLRSWQQRTGKESTPSGMWHSGSLSEVCFRSTPTTPTLQQAQGHAPAGNLPGPKRRSWMNCFHNLAFIFGPIA